MKVQSRNYRKRARSLKDKKSGSQIRCVAVLGSGTVKENSPIYKQAVALGRRLAKEGLTVYHGGYGGVMEAVARGVKEGGGHNVGVTIGKSLNGVNSWADAAIKTRSWEKRLLTLIKKGEAYIFLDGATGTLNELFFVWEMANKKLHQKPIIILGKQLRRLVQILKKDPSLRIPSNFYFATTIAQAVDQLRTIR